MKRLINRIGYFILAIIDQGPPKRFARNLRSGRMLGLFHWRSHYTFRERKVIEKVGYTTKSKAIEKQIEMSEKRNTVFANYRCIYCGNWHLGANRYKERTDKK